MDRELAVACALIDNMKNKATEQEAIAIDFALKILGNNIVPMPNNNQEVDKQYLDIDEATTYLKNKLNKEVSRHSVYQLFRKRDFPKDKIGKKFVVASNELENYVKEKKIWQL